jgi:hypothetical protein
LSTEVQTRWRFPVALAVPRALLVSKLIDDNRGSGHRDFEAHPDMMHRLIVYTLAVVSSLLIMACTGSVRAQTEHERIELILSKLPPQTSVAYKAMKKQARAATGQVLPLTKSEMWSVPKANVSGVKDAAEARGAGVRQLGPGWNEVLRPMPGARGTSERRKAVQERARSSNETMRIFMTERQKIMRERAESTKGTIRVSMMLASPPPVVEYALTRGVTDKALGKITIPIDDNTAQTVTRTTVAVKSDVIIWRGKVDGPADRPR